MSDQSAPPPAWLSSDEIAPLHVGAVQRKPEWSFQAWLHRFLERVVLPPCEIRGFDKASIAYAQIGPRMMALGRGLKDGSPDHEAVQGNPLVLVKFECKHGDGVPTPAQIATAIAYERCGVTVARRCRTIADALCALRTAGVRLHPNADNLAVEYQARVDAALRELAARKSGAAPKKKRASGKPRAARVKPSRIRAAHLAGVWRA